MPNSLRKPQSQCPWSDFWHRIGIGLAGAAIVMLLHLFCL